MASKLRNPETQAKLSGILVIAALAVLLVGLALAFQNFNSTTRTFVYAQDGKRMPIVYGIAMLSIVLSGGAFWFSYSSAGERRNSYSKLSWISFIASALVIVIGLVFLAANRFMAWIITKG